MQSPTAIFSASLEEKKSTFLAYLCPMSDFEALHVKLQAEHPKAAHIVWAKRFLTNTARLWKTIQTMANPKERRGLQCSM